MLKSGCRDTWHIRDGISFIVYDECPQCGLSKEDVGELQLELMSAEEWVEMVNGDDGELIKRSE